MDKETFVTDEDERKANLVLKWAQTKTEQRKAECYNHKAGFYAITTLLLVTATIYVGMHVLALLVEWISDIVSMVW